MEKAPFIEYAYVSWQAHLIDGEFGEGLVPKLHTLLSSRFISLWLEFRLAQDPESLWKLKRSCQAMQKWIDKALMTNNVEIEKMVVSLKDWCGIVLELLEEYDIQIQQRPVELHYLDIESNFSSAYLPRFALAQSNQQLRERETRLTPYINPTPNLREDPRRAIKLPHGTEQGLGFFLYDEKRDAFYFADKEMSSGIETLWVQNRQTGQRLPPMNRTLMPHRSDRVISAVFSRDFRYLAILYTLRRNGFCTTIWEIEDQLDFEEIKQNRPWARRLQVLFTNTEWDDSCCPLTARPDGLFCTPSGLVDPHRGIRQALPVKQGPSLYSAFSGDSRVLFITNYEGNWIEKICWLKSMPTRELLDLSLLVPSTLNDSPDTLSRFESIDAIDHDGNQIVIRIRVEGQDNVRYYLMNTVIRTVYALCDEKNVPIHYKYFLPAFMCFWNQSLIRFEVA